jgi:hypothetical protein
MFGVVRVRSADLSKRAPIRLAVSSVPRLTSRLGSIPFPIPKSFILRGFCLLVTIPIVQVRQSYPSNNLETNRVVRRRGSIFPIQSADGIRLGCWPHAPAAHPLPPGRFLVRISARS